MEEKIKILCITCPRGCALEITRSGGKIVDIKSGCKRGQEYAQRELSHPTRMVATTVQVKNGVHPLLPVYTSAPISKDQVEELMRELRKTQVSAPIHMGDVVVKNVLGSGVDILASRDMKTVE